MSTPAELETKFWKALESDRTIMLGIDGAEDGHTRPMTAQTQGSRSPIWFFAKSDNALVEKAGAGQRAIATFTAKRHDLFATLHGTLQLESDRSLIDRFWSRSVAAWYEGGKDDPSLRLLRLDPRSAEIWLHDSSVFDGVKFLFGADPKQQYAGKNAEVRLS
jgi:general stress protein 26